MPTNRATYRNPTGAGRGGPGRPKDPETVAGRLEDYAELRHQGHTRLHAIERLGLSYRTAMRYEARLRPTQDITIDDAQQGAA